MLRVSPSLLNFQAVEGHCLQRVRATDQLEVGTAALRLGNHDTEVTIGISRIIDNLKARPCIWELPGHDLD